MSDIPIEYEIIDDNGLLKSETITCGRSVNMNGFYLIEQTVPRVFNPFRRVSSAIQFTKGTRATNRNC